MIITITKHNGIECWIECEQGGAKAEEYNKRIGKGRVSNGNLFTAMVGIADFVNNELKEECLFEVV